MARKSRKTYRAKLYGIETPKKEEPEKLKLKTALYCRLSIADKKSGKESMTSQLALVRQFAAEKEDDLEVIGEFIDDGYSGTNFNRPQFKKMMEGIKEGRIQCIIVKDLSRLGRNYLDTSYLIEIILPLFNAELISVSDRIDTRERSIDNILIGLKNLMNQQYAEDISKKIGTVKRFRRSRGELVGSMTPYGYRRDPDDWKHLVVNEETAPVVRRIFVMASEGMSAGKIAATLTAERILTPMDYHRLQWTGERPEPRMRWSHQSVTRILQSEEYLGHVYYSTLYAARFLGEKRKNKPRSEWKVVRDVNPPIVSRELFDKAAEALKVRCLTEELKRGAAPYGYQWDPDDRRHLVIDEEAAEVVRRIFSMKIRGFSIAEIGRTLDRDGSLPPETYRYWKREGKMPEKEVRWYGASITAILNSEVYVGHMYYDTKQEGSPSRKHRSEWTVVKNENPAIITQEIFDQAKRESLNDRNKKKIVTNPHTYGYRNDPDHPCRMIPDPETSEVVRRIFEMRIQGMGNQKIADALNRDGVPSPEKYQKSRKGKEDASEDRKWAARSVAYILSSEVNLGHVYYDASEKLPDGRIRVKNRSEWKVKRHVNPPIITQETFDRANSAALREKIRHTPRRKPATYGYRLDPDNSMACLIDEEAAEVVRRIFTMKIRGFGLEEIAAVLEKEKILVPREYRKWKATGILPERPSPWKRSSVYKILRNEGYVGNVYYDTLDRDGHQKKRTEWKVLKGLNPAIIPQEMFDLAAEARKHGGDHKRHQPPYGYEKDPDHEGHIRIDEEAAEVVRRIFSMKASGMTDSEIASALNREGILIPLQYHQKKITGKEPEVQKTWRHDGVRKILLNERYPGHDRRGRIHDVIPPVISPEIFERAKAARAGRRKKRGGE